MTIVCPRCRGMLPWWHSVVNAAGRVLRLHCACGHIERLEADHD